MTWNLDRTPIIQGGLMRKVTSIIILLFLIMSCTIVFADISSSFTRLEVGAGIHTFVDLSTETGQVELLSETGIFGIAEYTITQTPTGEYIKFLIIDSNKNDLQMSQITNAGGSYWKDEVVRTYPENDYRASILYSEFGPYGYAAGTLYWYAVGLNTHNPGYVDVWYQGTLYYGDQIPAIISNEKL